MAETGLRRRLARLLLAAALVAPAAAARAAEGSSPDPYAEFAGGYAGELRGVARLADTGTPGARAAIEALRDGTLLAGPDGLLVIRDGASYRDARSGAVTAPDPGTLHPLRVNNRVRAAIGDALALMALDRNDDTAARTLFERHDPDTLAHARPHLERALAGGNASSAVRLAEAAAVLLSGEPSVARRLNAIHILSGGDGTARAVLATSLGNGSPSATDPTLAQATQAAIAAIDWRLRLWSGIQTLFYGLSLGSVLLLAALGLAIAFGVMGVINMAHGELMMVGAYVTYLVQAMLSALLPPAAAAALALPVAVPVAFLACGVLGVVIERGLIRFLYGRPLETLLATFGLSLVLQQAVRSLFGPTNVPVATPGWMSGAIQLGGVSLTTNRLVIILFAAVVTAGLALLLRMTPLGLQMRAVTQNRRMAGLMGIRTPRVDALTFGLGSGLAGLAGVAVTQIDNVSPNLGQGYIIDSFMVVVFGGVGNLWGTVAGALSLGIVNKLLEPVAGAVLGKIVVLVAIILFIQRRPRGMFPLKGRSVES